MAGRKPRARLGRTAKVVAQSQAIAALAQGMSQAEAAADAGCSVRTLQQWIAEDVAFSEALDQALLRACTAAQSRARAILLADAERAAMALRALSAGVWRPKLAPGETELSEGLVRALVREATRASIAILDRAGLGPRTELAIGTAEQWDSLDDQALLEAVRSSMPEIEARMGAMGLLLGAGGPPATAADGQSSESEAIDVRGEATAPPGGPEPPVSPADRGLDAASEATAALLAAVRGEPGPDDHEGGAENGQPSGGEGGS